LTASFDWLAQGLLPTTLIAGLNRSGSEDAIQHSNNLMVLHHSLDVVTQISLPLYVARDSIFNILPSLIRSAPSKCFVNSIDSDVGEVD